jgi:hypothetical protein
MEKRLLATYQKKKNEQMTKDFYPLFLKMKNRHIRKGHNQAICQQPANPFGFKSEAFDWFSNYHELTKALTAHFDSFAVARVVKPAAKRKMIRLENDLVGFYNKAGEELEKDEGLTNLQYMEKDKIGGKLPDDHLCIPTDCQDPYNFFRLQ